MIRLVCSQSSPNCSINSSQSLHFASYSPLQSVILYNSKQLQFDLIMKGKKSGDKVVDECLKILYEKTTQNTQKWIKDNHITSLNLRNNKALEIISISNYLLQKILINQHSVPLQLLNLLCDYHKKYAPKCHEYAHLLKHFSQWDYQFQYIFHAAMDKHLQQLGLYLRVRETVVHCDFNKGKKELLSGIWAELQEWASLAKDIFKEKEESDVIDHFTTVVKNHYVQVKKSQSEKINGAEFFRICQIIDRGEQQVAQTENKVPKKVKNKAEPEQVTRIFEESTLNGLSSQDRQLIRVLSYQDKNVARMLEQKHTKMVHLIGEEVYALRKDINYEKERYIEVVEQKNALMRIVEKLKQSTLRYILDHNEATQFDVLQQLSNFNKKYSPRSVDVHQTIEIINNRRLIEIIEKEEMENDES